jgi:hypothetical protein
MHPKAVLRSMLNPTGAPSPQAWVNDAVDALAASDEWGYYPGDLASTEPTALAAMALLACGKYQDATRALDWLSGVQSAQGSLGTSASAATPCWPTGLAVIAWQSALIEPDRIGDSARAASYSGCAARAAAWLLSVSGETQPLLEEMGHDTTLRGWPWVIGTHSWVEPTAFGVLALKAVGQSRHPRTREAVKLLENRLFPEGGANYGNTVVLGQQLLPHLQPSGVALLALAGEPTEDTATRATLGYVAGALSPATTASSLAFGVMGLTAHQARPEHIDAWLEAAAKRVQRTDASPYKLTLLALAALGDRAPLVNVGDIQKEVPIAPLSGTLQPTVEQEVAQ